MNDYLVIITNGIGIPKDNVKDFQRQIELDLLAQIYGELDLEASTPEHVLQYLRNLIDDKQKETRNTRRSV